MERDYVCKNLSIGFEGVFCLDEFYRFAKGWFSKYKYDFGEVEYREIQRSKGSKDVHIKWYAEKKYNDYIKYVVETDIVMEDVREVKAKKKNTCECRMKLKINGYLLKDYEEKWIMSPLFKFLREVYDKFTGSELEKCSSELNEEAKKFTNELRAYLNMRRM